MTNPPAPPSRIPALLLAAGRSARMAPADKLMQPVRGLPLIRDRAICALAAGLDLHVALPSADHPRALTLAGLPLRTLVLPGSAEGMGGTLREGLAALPEAPLAMILLADLPDLTVDDLRRMLAAAVTDPQALAWRGTDATGLPGHPILISAALRPAFVALSGDDGGRTVLSKVGDRTVMVPLPGRHATRDLDTPEDWHCWRRDQNDGSGPTRD